MLQLLTSSDPADERHQQLCQLPIQGEIARSLVEKLPNLWVEVVQALPPEPPKFALNASLNNLQTNANLHTWGEKAIIMKSTKVQTLEEFDANIGNIWIENTLDAYVLSEHTTVHCLKIRHL